MAKTAQPRRVPPPAITITPVALEPTEETNNTPSFKNTHGLLTPRTFKRKHEGTDDTDYAKYKLKKKWEMKVHRERMAQQAAGLCLGSTEDTPPPTPTTPSLITALGENKTQSYSPSHPTVFRFDFKAGYDSTPSTPLSIDSGRVGSPNIRTNSPSVSMEHSSIRSSSPHVRATFPSSPRTTLSNVNVRSNSPNVRMCFPYVGIGYPNALLSSPNIKTATSTKTFSSDVIRNHSSNVRTPSPYSRTERSHEESLRNNIPSPLICTTRPTRPTVFTFDNAMPNYIISNPKDLNHLNNGNYSNGQRDQQKDNTNVCLDLSLPKRQDQRKPTFDVREDAPLDYSVKSALTDVNGAQHRVYHSKAIKAHDDLRLFITDLPNDPRDWSREDVGNWLKYMKYCRGIQDIKLERFPMNGKGICLMDLNMFLYRVPTGGKMLYRDFEMRLCLAVNGKH